MEIDEIVKLLEETAPTASDWHNIGTILRKQGLENHEHPLWKYVFAFEYMYVEETNRDYFERYGPFAPWIEMQGRVFPPPLNAISDEILTEWASVLEKVKHPVLCSRLADLLWIRKWGKRPDLYTRQAIDSYLEVSKGEWIELERAYCLVRALDLSKKINDTDRKAKSISSTIDACYLELRSESPKPGVSLRFIEALMKLPKTEIPGEVDALLDLAIKVHKNDVWIIENILGLMIRRANPEKQKELQLYQISRWVEDADKSEKGILQLHHLEHALELARNYGFQDVADEMRRRIQSVPEEDLELKTISAKVEIPSEKMEEYLNWFVDDRGWKESFTRFGSHSSPSGDYKKNIEEIEKNVQDFPLQFLVTQAVYDENNVPIRFGRSTDENKEIALAHYETMSIRLFGSFAPNIFQRIIQKHGLPALDELTDFFTTQIIPKDISVNVAQAVDWYFKEEYDVAAHLLTPRIEAIFRILARELGLPIIREPVGSTPGSVVQLGNLLTMLQGRIDESWRRYFYNLLANPISVNLRNRICHGLLPKVGKEDATLLIHVACNLRLIRVSSTDTPEKQE
jgi:hypothetical protein